MAIARKLKESPKSTTTYPSLFRDVIADYLIAQNLAEGPKPMATAEARIRHSWAGKCARQIGYFVRGDVPEPFEAETLWGFAMGHRAHEIVQAAFRARYPEAAEIEVKVGAGAHAGTFDIMLRFDTAQPFEVDGVTYLCKVVVLELKSTGGFGFSRKVREEGPDQGAVLQCSLNGMAVDADLIVIGYLSLDRQVQMANQLYGKRTKRDLDGVWATWAYPKDVYLPWAESEARRMDRILEVVDSGRLPARKVPGMDPGAVIVDPATGRWEVRDEEGLNIFSTGTLWVCDYCSFQEQCVADAEAEREFLAEA